MHYEELVQDFASRTLINLEFIEEAKNQGQRVYEATQLLNSMLGLIIFPVEEYVKKIENRFGLDKRIDDALKSITIIKGHSRFNDNYDHLRLIRNAFAHGNVKIRPSSGNEINSIIIWNVANGSGLERSANWKAEISLEVLRELGISLAEALKRHVLAVAAD